MKWRKEVEDVLDDPPTNLRFGFEMIARKLEALSPTKQPLESNLLDGKWELIYTTSQSILQTKRPKFLRSRKNYQGINVDTLRAQNMESFPFFNQVTIPLYFSEGNLFVLKMVDPNYRVPTKE
ncbi:hypothetical protein LIER_33202 [Lithospermum erythrorhizon]|uniref:Plastid lipid-associated protein/fibrillin conserved domain-containing protein n=1 Tax=Lithospermum erythrorhizon TaxID=34254 RepID=A0AAV3RZQ8_LITER